MMVWDGACGFCRYWVVRWQKITGEAVTYRPYEAVAEKFPDIEIKTFQRAVRFIEKDGSIYSGAGAAYRAFTYATKWGWIWKIYRDQKWFRTLSDATYDLIAKHRPFMLRVTHLLFGTNPEKTRPYWLIYLVLIALLILVF